MCRADEPVAGIGNRGCTSVGDERDFGAALQSVDQIGRAALLVMLEVADGRRANGMRREQTPGAARVLAGYQVRLTEHANRARGDIVGITDRRRDDVEDAVRGRGGPFIRGRHATPVAAANARLISAVSAAPCERDGNGASETSIRRQP